MKRHGFYLLACVFVFLACFAAGCAVIPVSLPTEYTDPLTMIGGSSETPRFDDMNLGVGVVLSESFYNASKQLEDKRAISTLMQEGRIDLDPRYVVQTLNEGLKKQFTRVIPLKDVQEAVSKDVDLIVIIDMNINLGKVSGKITQVKISCAFQDVEGRVIDIIEAEGSQTLPYPARTYVFRPSADYALSMFMAKLKGSEKLATYAQGYTTQVNIRESIELPDLDVTPVNIAVAELRALALSEGETGTLSEKLRSTLVQTKYFRVLSSRDMKGILAQQNFQQSDYCDDRQCLVEMGRILAVQKIIGGSVGRVGKTFHLSLRMVDVETGEIEFSSDRNYKGEPDELIVLIEETGLDLCGQYADQEMNEEPI